MSCHEVENEILEGHVGSAAQTHIQHCASCRQFQSVQQGIDDLCAKAFAAPSLRPDFERSVRRKLQREKRQKQLSAMPAILAVGAGLGSTGICVAVVPEIAALVIPAGVVLSLIALFSALAFEWLSEELGEA